MDLLLIVPPVFTTEEGIYPHLGIISIASYIKAKSNFEVEILDLAYKTLEKKLSHFNNMYEEYAREIIEKNPKIVGITTLNVSLSIALNLAKHIKQLDNRIIVVFGGPGIDGLEKVILSEFAQVDFILSGEGEEVTLDLLSAIVSHRKVGDINGLSGRNGNEIYVNPKKTIMDLDSLPTPDYSLVPAIDKYAEVSGRSAVSVELARGCASACEFCGCSSFWGKRRRTFSPMHVVNQIGELYRIHNMDHVYLTDDNFIINRKFAIDFASKLKDKELTITWDTRGRIDSIDEELLQILEAAGCNEILIGVESTSDEILNAFKKRISAKDQYEKIMMVMKTRILPILSFILGHPLETKISLNETLYFICRLYTKKKPLASHFHMMTLIPGTELYKKKYQELDLEKKIYKYRDYRIGNMPMLAEDEELIKNYPYIFSSFYNVKSHNIDILTLEFIAKYYCLLCEIYPYTLFLLYQMDMNLVTVMEKLIVFLEKRNIIWYKVLEKEKRTVIRNLFYEYLVNDLDLQFAYKDILTYENHIDTMFNMDIDAELALEIEHDIFSYIRLIKEDDQVKSWPKKIPRQKIVLRKEGEKVKIYGKK